MRSYRISRDIQAIMFARAGIDVNAARAFLANPDSYKDIEDVQRYDIGAPDYLGEQYHVIYKEGKGWSAYSPCDTPLAHITEWEDCSKEEFIETLKAALEEYDE